MSGRFRGVLPLPVLLGFSVLVAGQPAHSPHSAPAPADTAVHVSVGRAVVPLHGPWKFQVGDSPMDPATNKPLWAEPQFDDSRWETVDLTPKAGDIDPTSGTSGYVPGWTAKGHPGYWGYAWYRIRVQVEASPGTKLALAGPPDVDDSYQLFDNAGIIGSFGDFSSGTTISYYAQPRMFQLSNADGETASAPTHVLAFRVWMHPTTLRQSDEVGGLKSAPLLGEATAVAAWHQVQWDELLRSYAGVLIAAVVFGLLGVVALSLTLFDRSDRVYLWIGAQLLLIAGIYFVELGAIFTERVSADTSLVLDQIFAHSLTFAGWVMVWRVWFRLRRPVWIPWALAGLAAMLMISNLLSRNLVFTIVPPSLSHPFQLVSLALRLVLALLMLGTVFQGIREQGLEGWVALPAMLLVAIAEFYQELFLLHILRFWFPFGIQITTRQLANLLLVAVMAVLLLRRLVLSLRAQRLMAMDVKQAQEVQQVILPEARIVLPGLVIESEYRPAREVGGDFFQIIPHKTDGSLLIVAGDVTGKGLKAGMLVALLVGAIRMAAETITDPLRILEALNRRLLGRSDAQATCLALRIDTDGTVTLANAGHIAPYFNGEPLELDGALPLGMMEGAEFSAIRFNLRESDRLVLVSDGIAEATDANGKLFGFERVDELMHGACSAADLANTAQTFGQEDDISVISVTRTKAQVPAMA